MAKAKKKSSRKTIKPWTAQDLKLLKTMARQKVPTKTVAKKLGRTPGAVSVKASRAGISLAK